MDVVCCVGDVDVLMSVMVRDGEVFLKNLYFEYSSTTARSARVMEDVM